MSNAFEQARGVEAISREILHPFIEQRALNGQYITTDKGRLARELQKTVGDVLMNGADGRLFAVEIKAERKNEYSNLFLEIWSNLSRYTPGWMLTLDCDVLFYHFIEDDDLLIIDFQKLKHWAFRQEASKTPHRIGNIWKFPLRKQKRYSQLNDTHGACVPISVLREEVGIREFHPAALSGMSSAA